MCTSVGWFVLMNMLECVWPLLVSLENYYNVDMQANTGRPKKPEQREHRDGEEV